MRYRILSILAVPLLLGAQNAPDTATIKEIEKALQALNNAFEHQDAVAIRRLMTEDHVAVTPYYGLYSKAEQLKSLTDLKLKEYQTKDIKVTLATKDAAVITYALAIEGTFKGKNVTSKNLVIAVWVKRDGQWQEASYQETPVDGK